MLIPGCKALSTAFFCDVFKNFEISVKCPSGSDSTEPKCMFNGKALDETIFYENPKPEQLAEFKRITNFCGVWDIDCIDQNVIFSRNYILLIFS